MGSMASIAGLVLGSGVLGGSGLGDLGGLLG
jgi:hypothetical protein